MSNPNSDSIELITRALAASISDRLSRDPGWSGGDDVREKHFLPSGGHPATHRYPARDSGEIVACLNGCGARLTESPETSDYGYCPAAPWPHLPDGRLDIDAIEEMAAAAPPYLDRDGVEGRIVLSPPIRPWERKGMEFRATEHGKEHPRYRKIRAQLHDDHVTDLRCSDPDAWADHLSRALRRPLP